MSTEPKQHQPIAVVACRVMQQSLVDLLPESVRQQAVFMDYGLHRSPELMKETLQEALHRLTPARRVLLGYGLCGTGLDGIRAGAHTLIIPKVDDCIAILLGSRRAYRRQFDLEPGTYYLTTGWLETGSHPLKEYREYVETYGKAEADWIMDSQYQHYRRLVYIAHSREELERYRPKAQAVARFCERWDMRYEEITGSKRYFQRMVEMIVNPQAGDDEFIVVPPSSRVRQEQFYE